MEFFNHIKATQKSGKPDAVYWGTFKTEARANLALDVALEDAGIETGRGKDYLKPIRTDMPVVDDLPEEGVVCFEFCKRYTLADDQRTWKEIPGAATQGETTPTPVVTSDADLPAAPVTSTDTAVADNTSLLENRTPAVRFAVHLLGDKYLSEISQEQQIVANELATDEVNAYFQNMLQAKNDVADIGDLSLHAEWKLVQAVKDVFPQDKEHESALLAAFMSGWIKAEDRNQLVEDWKSGKLPARDEAPKPLYEHGLQISEHDTGGAHYPVCKMPFRKQLLAQLTVDELRHHITRSENAELHALEMDTDNGYIQDLLLAAENFPEVKAFDTKDLWRYTNAIRKVFSMDKRHELGLLLQFTKAWVATPYIDRGILTREWAAGNRINLVQRTDAGTNADGGYVTDRGEGAHHTLETLDLEIASALLPMDFNYREIPVSIARRAKEIIAKKEEPWKSWSKILRNQPGVLAVNRAAIFNLVRIAPENIHLTPAAHLEFVNRTMTAEFNSATELLPIQAASAAPVVNEITINPADEKSSRAPLCTHEENLKRVREEGARRRADEANSQPQVANLGGGVFAIDDLMNEKQSENDDRSSVNEETTSDVQMEETDPTEGENIGAVPPGESADAADPQTDAVAETVCTGCSGCPDCGAVAGDATYAAMESGLKEELGPDTSNTKTMFTHLMVDLETMGKKPGAPIVSIGAVFFDPSSGKTGAEFYQVINLESSMSFGARPDASTILWWLKQSSEARSAIVVDDTVGLLEALELFLDFIAENAANGSRTVQLWGNGSSFDCSLLEAAFELADTPFPIPHWNYRDVRTVVELGKAVGLNSRYEIPFEGDQHNALADARHQVKYVSAIWQRLTAI
ncbi:exonuclease [Leclercia adecarboxylata]|uniref:exonuclease n=1 Tax=Leclercia adecarboxylata TaxID=83655 RepID=UPI0004E41EF5|nr:exonuclease [Leclercia adecarboxylata]KFC90295.1 exodeoxyribonuclease VIII [Leclercia adecarboxylata ATCC 23216 = NBRC 102595]UBH69647.1 3'-5' exoribonuclease [Leclercia adecarboxylata]SPX64062.1 Exodeoxyribonuclease 8 [Leclercia adecarboxylata]STX26548.1 Exodeoxyribonuclease 8 [Leclercia adecarboxylata]